MKVGDLKRALENCDDCREIAVSPHLPDKRIPRILLKEWETLGIENVESGLAESVDIPVIIICEYEDI